MKSPLLVLQAMLLSYSVSPRIADRAKLTEVLRDFPRDAIEFQEAPQRARWGLLHSAGRLVVSTPPSQEVEALDILGKVLALVIRHGVGDRDDGVERAAVHAAYAGELPWWLKDGEGAA